MRKPPTIPMTFVICALVGVGLVVTTVQGILHAPEYMSAYFTRVEHPIKPNFDAYDKLLSQIVRRNRVDYCAARNNKYLDQALRLFAEQGSDEFASDGDRLVYWINAYNLCVIKTIADHYPIKSIEEVMGDINGRPFTLGGQALTPKEIRQQRIQPLLRGSSRGDYTDCRAILLICGGAMGYPAILDHAITLDTIKNDMGENTFKFIRIRYNVYYEPLSHTMYISPLFQWNESLFSRSFPDPFEFVIFYLYPGEKPDSLDFHFKKTYNKKFDWRVNDVSTPD